MGRQPRAEVPATRIIKATATEDEKMQFQRLAKDLGMTESNTIRLAISLLRQAMEQGNV